MSDDGVWVGWDIDEDGEPGGYSLNRIGGPRILVPSENWAEYQRAKQLVRLAESTWAPLAVAEQRVWDAAHPPPPPNPVMAAIGEMVVKSMDFTRMLKFADRVNRAYDEINGAGGRVDVRLPERYRPKENA